MNNCVLIIDKDLENSKRLKYSLQGDGTDAYYAISVTDGLERLSRESYLLVVFDIFPPAVDSLTQLKIIRTMETTPILALASSASVLEKEQFFLNGADDYLSKPFDLNEFLARSNVLIRCYARLKTEEETRCKLVYAQGLYMNPVYRKTYLKNMEICLTRREFDILYLLAFNPGQVFTHEQIYRLVWNDEFVGAENSILCNIRRIRRKLESVPDTPNYIQTVRGVGYCFNPKSA